MKKILVSMMTIALVSALIGGGIYAAFTDTEEGDIEFRAGTLDLTVDGRSETWHLTVEGLIPDAEGDEDPFELRNIGSIYGNLTISFGAVHTPPVRGTRGTATHNAANEWTLQDSTLTVGDVDHWKGFYLTLYDEVFDTQEPKLVIGSDPVSGTLTIEGTWDDPVEIGQRYALQTEWERSTLDHADIDGDFLEVAFKVGDDKYLNPSGGMQDTIVYGNLADFTATEHYLSVYELGPNETVEFKAYWKTQDVLDADEANKYQGASVSAPVTFTLTQLD